MRSDLWQQCNLTASPASCLPVLRVDSKSYASIEARTSEEALFETSGENHGWPKAMLKTKQNQRIVTTPIAAKDLGGQNWTGQNGCGG